MSTFPEQEKSATSSRDKATASDAARREAARQRELTIDAAVEMTFPASDPPAWMPPGGARPASDAAAGMGARSAGAAPVSDVERQSPRAPARSERPARRATAGPRSRDEQDTPPDGPVARGGSRREPLADRVPRPAKRTAGAAVASQTPANIRVDGVRLDDEDRAYIRRRLGEKLGKYAPSIERVTVRVRDVNGPRGGVDLLCRIKVVLSGLPSVVAEHRAASLRPALTSALASVERAVRRTVQRTVQRSRTRPDGDAGEAAGRDD